MGDERRHSWRVEGVIPKEHSDGRQWAKNVNVLAIAPTFEEAVAAVRAKYPHMKIIKAFSDQYVHDVIVVEV